MGALVRASLPRWSSPGRESCCAPHSRVLGVELTPHVRPELVLGKHKGTNDYPEPSKAKEEAKGTSTEQRSRQAEPCQRGSASPSELACERLSARSCLSLLPPRAPGAPANPAMTLPAALGCFAGSRFASFSSFSLLFCVLECRAASAQSSVETPVTCPGMAKPHVSQQPERG